MLTDIDCVAQNYNLVGQKVMKTDIFILLDRSGSMYKIKEATEAGIRDFIQTQHGTGATISLAQFDDGGYNLVLNRVRPEDTKGVTLEPRGNTPLVDSICRAIDDLGRDYSQGTIPVPDRVLMVIVTDGLENASYKFRKSDVNERISRQTKEYKWEFMYIGANQDAIAEANSYGIPSRNALLYSANVRGTTSAWKSAGGVTRGYSIGDVTSCNFSPEDRVGAVDQADNMKPFPMLNIALPLNTLIGVK